jgi:hypothetical protein
VQGGTGQRDAIARPTTFELWESLNREAKLVAEQEVTPRCFIDFAIFAHDEVSSALTAVLAKKIANDSMSYDDLKEPDREATSIRCADRAWCDCVKRHVYFSELIQSSRNQGSAVAKVYAKCRLMTTAAFANWGNRRRTLLREKRLALTIDNPRNGRCGKILSSLSI